MKTISGKRICQMLEGKGWFLLRVNGSHHIYAKSGHIEKISVPVHGQKALKRGLQKHIMKLADIGQSEL